MFKCHNCNLDGNSESNFGGQSCTHTSDWLTDPEQWRVVDLQAVYTIAEVSITTRGDINGNAESHSNKHETKIFCRGVS